MSVDDIEALLSELIKSSKDGQQRFARAARRTRNPRLKSLFLLRSMESGHAACELGLLLDGFGREPAGNGARAGHRRWARPKMAAEDGGAAELAELEGGQEQARMAYTRVMQAQLPPEILTVLQKQYHGVLRNVDEVRRLRGGHRAIA
jgi:uncharacterized protein (TIGR02284 family)